MSILLDSDVLIYYYNELKPWVSFIDHLLDEDEVFISTVSVMEVCAGWDEAERRINLPDLYGLFTIAPLTPAIAERAGALRHRGKHKEKRKPRPVDALIAATAIEHNYRLITNNRKDFTIPGLELYRELWRN